MEANWPNLNGKDTRLLIRFFYRLPQWIFHVADSDYRAALSLEFWNCRLLVDEPFRSLHPSRCHGTASHARRHAGRETALCRTGESDEWTRIVTE